ncbi:hypothetical protein PHLGIDRAFT_58180, partial [Phlebiopsis gigantea 11061_1 CR5-6]
RKPPRDFLVGITLLLIVVLLWTVAGFVVQVCSPLRTARVVSAITYFNTGSLVIYLIPYAAKYLFAKFSSHNSYQPLLPEAEDDPVSVENAVPFSAQEVAALAAKFAFPYFAMNWCFVGSYKYTSVASSTIIGGTLGFFTLILGHILRVELMTRMKIIAVVTRQAQGIALVSWSDTSPAAATSPAPDADFARAPLWGDFLALVAAVIGALYLVLFKHHVRDEARLDMRLLFGLFGLFNLLWSWPIGVALHLAGVERFALPEARRTVLALLVNAGVTVTGDLMYLIAMMKTTPLVVSVGQSLTMPLAVLGDFFLHGTASLLAILGCVIVLLSFGVLGLESPTE